MNDIAAFGLNLLVTLLLAFLVSRYLGPSLFLILVDLCGTEPRARFWLTFSRILLIGMPAVTALGYHPHNSTDSWYLDLAGELSLNLVSLLVTVVGLGMVITFFAAIAPRQPKENAS